MITNPREGMRVRLDGPHDRLGGYEGSVVTLTHSNTYAGAWYFIVDEDHPLYEHGTKWCDLDLMYPVATPPKFTTPAEAQAWLDANSEAS